MPRLIQPSFARGEIGSDLYGRVDVGAYAIALRTAYNAVIHSYGGVSNRAGLPFVGPCKNHTGIPPRIIEFKYNTEDTYILEFGALYMRVIRNDAHVLETAVNITGATAANPVVVTAAGHGNADGDQVYITDVVGMSELNGRWFTIANKTSTTFELTSQQTGANIDGTGYTAYISGGTTSKVYEIVTPYAVADLLELKFVQSANVMTLTHPDYPPKELSRTGHTAWTLSTITFEPEQGYPTGVTAAADTTGTDIDRYKVTAIAEDTAEESLSGLDNTAIASASATAADPVVVTAASHPFGDGDEVEISGYNEMTEVNGRRFKVANSTANTFELEGEDGSGYAAETTGGSIYPTFSTIANSKHDTHSNTITWDAEVGALKYAVYREEHGLWALIGETELLTFTDGMITADTSITPPRARNPFYGAGNYPATVSYYQQRRVFGQTNNAPDTKYYSVTGSAKNMSVSSPRQADDAITSTLNSLEVNEIRHFVPGNDLLVFTSGSEWKVNSGAEAAFSAETLRQKPQSYWGSAHLRPLTIGDKTLFMTENASYVRSLGYELTIDGYKGSDMTVFAPHLFRDFIGIDWAKSSSPDPIIQVVREDGIVPTLTFNPEQEVVAWTRWGTDGKFKRIASTRPNTSEVDTASYFVVERTIGGQPAWYIERTASRRFTDVRDCFFVDCGLSYDTPLAITGATTAYPVVITAIAHGFSDGDEIDTHDIKWVPNIDQYFNETQPAQLNGYRFFVASSDANTFELVSNEGRKDITGATQANPVVITSTDHGFSDGEVVGSFNVAGMTELNGNTYKVANKTDDTFELTTLADANVDGTAYTAYTSGGQLYPAADGSAFNAYREDGTARLAVDTFAGAWHLEGRTDVVALADGDVITDITIANGGFTLPRKYSRVHVGLRYITDIGTLDPEAPQGTIQGMAKRVPFATLRLKDTRGLLIGQDSTEMSEMKQRENELMGEPTRLLTGDKEIELFGDWEGGGRVFIRQIYPLPITLTALVPFLDLGDEDD